MSVDLVAVTARTIAGSLVACLRAGDRASFYRAARAVLAAVEDMLDDEERREVLGWACSGGRCRAIRRVA